MKTAYTILALTLIGLVALLHDSDHGSKQAFADSIRTAGHFAKR